MAQAREDPCLAALDHLWRLPHDRSLRVTTVRGESVAAGRASRYAAAG